MKYWPGALFPYLLDALYILIENAVRHSGVDRPQIEIQGGDAVGAASITVANLLGREVDLAAIRAIVPTLQERANHFKSGAIVRSEGGTGYFKLGKILGDDLSTCKPSVTVALKDVNEDNEQFRSTITLHALEDHK